MYGTLHESIANAVQEFELQADVWCLVDGVLKCFSCSGPGRIARVRRFRRFRRICKPKALQSKA
jgi:hypothetical protein